MTNTLQASVLAAPPPPPIPALREPLAPDALAAALRAFSGCYYANHPFHHRMHEGKLTKRQLQGWVANRLAYQRAIPRKDAAILSNCPEPADVRLRAVGQNRRVLPGNRSLISQPVGDPALQLSFRQLALVHQLMERMVRVIGPAEGPERRGQFLGRERLLERGNRRGRRRRENRRV